ncbi:MAG: DUF4198 domain-containing protein [Spirosoma sp.]|nr:DUF4198 domain-containing protein [Spirosoma sp.]
MKKFPLVIGFCVLAGLALAHEFWLEPSQYVVRTGARINIQVMVGESFDGERSEGVKNRIVQYRHHTTIGSTDLAPALTNGAYGNVTVQLNTPGTHLFSFANTPKFLAMKADSFLLYLQEDGLTNVIAARKQRSETGKPSRELYQRCVKTLVQVGNKPDNTFAKPTGMPLEIMADKNPYSQRVGQPIGYRILFGNKPVSGALVRYWNRDLTNQLSEEKQRSDAQGRVQFALKPGKNMVSVVHMIPASDTAQARYQPANWHSYWGSLTFGSK